MKPYVLIVEDEAILYERLRRVLSKERLEIGPYTPSVARAKEIIEARTPDIVLLDIDLQGGLSGLDLGKQLNENYGIPFIYVTQHNDNRTFYQGLSTEHEQFIVKTKPQLNTQEILRAIETVLARSKKNSNLITLEKDQKEIISTSGILGLTNYLDILRESAIDTISRVPVAYQDILYFTVKPFPIKEDSNVFENTRTNYLWFKTKSGDRYFLKSSLRQLKQTLPTHFMRINESYIVNLNPDVLDGKINGSRLSISGEVFLIKDTYKDQVKQKLSELYLE